MRQAGFTLIEMLVALAISAVALMALSERIGMSTSIQGTLGAHSIAMDYAMTLLETERLKPKVILAEVSGSDKFGSTQLNWRMWTEKTEQKSFIRRNVEVEIKGEHPVRLFLYRATAGWGS